jgi:hypothetical protein
MTPAPMSDEQIMSTGYNSGDPEGLTEFAKAIIAARDAMWSEMLGERKSFAEVHPANQSAQCECEHWQSCAECHPTAHKNVEEIDTSEKRVQKSEEIKQVAGFGKVLGTYGTVEKWPDTGKEVK